MLLVNAACSDLISLFLFSQFSVCRNLFAFFYFKIHLHRKAEDHLNDSVFNMHCTYVLTDAIIYLFYVLIAWFLYVLNAVSEKKLPLWNENRSQTLNENTHTQNLNRTEIENKIKKMEMKTKNVYYVCMESICKYAYVNSHLYSCRKAFCITFEILFICKSGQLKSYHHHHFYCPYCNRYLPLCTTLTKSDTYRCTLFPQTIHTYC